MGFSYATIELSQMIMSNCANIVNNLIVTDHMLYIECTTQNKSVLNI